jgi:hypothetical protein
MTGAAITVLTKTNFKETPMKQQRIYIVGHGQTIRLVRASHRSQALSHVAKSLINVKVANQDELVEALGRQIAVENASDGEQGELEL